VFLLLAEFDGLIRGACAGLSSGSGLETSVRLDDTASRNLGDRAPAISPFSHAVIRISRCIASMLASASVTVTYFMVLAMAA
jgi:hypothetical protein